MEIAVATSGLDTTKKGVNESSSCSGEAPPCGALNKLIKTWVLIGLLITILVNLRPFVLSLNEFCRTSGCRMLSQNVEVGGFVVLEL